MLQQKKKEAEAHKERTMAMYDNMAKSAPAGDQKRLDTSMLKPENKCKQLLSLTLASNCLFFQRLLQSRASLQWP